MGWLEERYKSTQEVGEDGKIGGKGLGAFLWQQFVDEEKINANSQRALNTRTAVAAGENIKDLDGITDQSSIYDVQGAIATKGRERQREAEQRSKQTQIELQESSQKPQMAQIAANTAAQKDSNQLLREQLLQQAREAQLTRADNADARAAELEFRMLESQKEDRRYNERMEQLDRKDRRQAMSSLAGGLAALGAAFAL